MDATVGIPPAVTEETAPFWAAAAEGRLLVERCAACGAESFPPRGMCRSCHGREMVPAEITGPGHVYSFTVNYQRWLPELAVPYAIVLVEFADHPGVRVAGRLRGCAPEDAAIGMPVGIGFEPGPGGFAIPSFLTAPPPAGDSSAPPPPPGSGAPPPEAGSGAPSPPDGSSAPTPAGGPGGPPAPGGAA